MRCKLLAFLFLTALVSSALGDALILKNGRKVVGRVTDKKDHYEVQVEGQALTFDKDEVQQWIKSPREITGDVEKLVEEAKKLYSEAVELKDESAAEAKFRDALPKVKKARELLTEARDLFPEGYTELDFQLVNVMKLMRLVRERFTSHIAAGEPVKTKEAPQPKVEVKPAPEPKVEPPPAEFGLLAALAIFVDPARRSDAKQRGQAQGYFKKNVDGKSPISDLAMSAQVLLSKSDIEWKLPVDAVQAFFKSATAEKLEALSEKEIVEGLKALASRIKDLRAKGVEPAFDPLLVLAAGAASSLIEKAGGKPSPEVESVFKDLGFEKSEFGAVWGRKAGLAMEDYRNWSRTGEYALGLVQFQKDYTTLPELAPKYAFALLSTFKAIQDNRYYNRAAVQFELLARVAPPVARDHMLAMAKSIRDNSPCPVCAGTHKINCNICRGKGKFNAQCGRCGGAGKVNFGRGDTTCPNCKGAGTFRDVKCEKCKQTGKIDCKARGCEREVKPPAFEAFADAFQCHTCGGRGTLARHVALECPDCWGIGIMLQPRSDPSKLLK